MVYFLDAGVFQPLRPRGPLDSPDEIEGPALETLFLQNLRAINDYRDLGYDLSHWRAATGEEVDFVLHGERGLRAFEVKRSARVRPEDLRGLRRFLGDYPEAKACLVHVGTRRWHESGIDIVPMGECLTALDEGI
jgi:predicted AAA+ superfamily ATPase